MTTLTRQEKLLQEAENLLAQSERETQRMRDVVELLRATLREADGDDALQTATPSSAPTEKPFSELPGTMAAEMVIRAAGRPLHISKIVDLMESRGFNVGDPTKYQRGLYANLIRQPRRFRKVKPGTFGLAAIELPLAQ